MPYQQEGPDDGDLVELHEEPQSLLVVTAVLAVYREALPLQNRRERQVRIADLGLDTMFQ